MTIASQKTARVERLHGTFTASLTDKKGPRLEFKRPLKNLSRDNIIMSWRATELSRFKCGLLMNRMEQCGSGTAGRKYLRDLPDGVHNFYVGARDALGNEANIIKHTFKIGRKTSALVKSYGLRYIMP